MTTKSISFIHTEKGRFGIWLVIITIALACIMLGIQAVGLYQRNISLEENKARLEEQLKEEQNRTLEIEDEEDYVKTREFIEKKAKALGYVYPDEIIFIRESDE